MATITLDGVEYSTRKRTNRLRAELEELQERKQAAALDEIRAATEVDRLGALAEKGEMPEDGPDRVADAMNRAATASKARSAVTPDIALVVLVDSDGNPPTADLIDEHADLDELEQVVAVALGTATENPTTAPPAGS